MRQSAKEKARTHERIIQIASARIREEGIDGPGVAEIMREAGLTHGGFYKHFGSREDLVAEAADDAFAHAARTLDKYARDEREPLAAWVDWYLSTEHRDDPATGCPSRRWSATSAAETITSAAATTLWSSDTSAASRACLATATTDDARPSSLSARWSDRSPSHARSTTTRFPTKSCASYMKL